VDVRLGDYDRPETLADAFEGTDTLVFVSASIPGQRAALHRAVVEAAVAAKVGRIVYTSITHADTSAIPLAAEHLATEELLRDSGMAYTFLRNNWYLENYTGNLAGFGVPAGFATILARSDAAIAGGALDVVTGDLSRLIGRPTTTLEQFLAGLG
jgi:NAD(P)H dehydrogenase (quinone)